MRSKNEVLCAEAGSFAAEGSKAGKPAKTHKTIFASKYIYYFFSNFHNKLLRNVKKPGGRLGRLIN
jgi:hypothetical protein